MDTYLVKFLGTRNGLVVNAASPMKAKYRACELSGLNGDIYHYLSASKSQLPVGTSTGEGLK